MEKPPTSIHYRGVENLNANFLTIGHMVEIESHDIKIGTKRVLLCLVNLLLFRRCFVSPGRWRDIFFFCVFLKCGKSAVGVLLFCFINYSNVVFVEPKSTP